MRKHKADHAAADTLHRQCLHLQHLACRPPPRSHSPLSRLPQFNRHQSQSAPDARQVTVAAASPPARRLVIRRQCRTRATLPCTNQRRSTNRRRSTTKATIKLLQRHTPRRTATPDIGCFAIGNEPSSTCLILGKVHSLNRRPVRRCWPQAKSRVIQVSCSMSIRATERKKSSPKVSIACF
ncbi:hypothetical protein TBK1r_11370 [Stieleria magnilauensis]|uniref:Uncharacterized protein n=1 Tax=Stieleria magnilauensis TaxID=2527963 RepID=A0ABX5XKB2_9BACT|nr:hypothetical protein TBK1r_11370 [Planctomycetes bacterium TBK1r]